MAETASRRSLVEEHSIDFIPAGERRGSAWHLFFVWWSSNMQMTTVVTGALAVIFGLSFVWALVAIVIGTLVGGLFMALHSAQGPVLGIPQMIQSRAQFGFAGAVIPVAVAFVMYVGFFAASNLFGAQAVTAAVPAIPLNAGIFVVAAVTVLLAIFGYDHIHRWARISGYLFLAAFIALTISLWARGLVPARVFSPGPLSAGPFLLMLATAAIWIISYAVYVSDYSRYLPEQTSRTQAFWYSYLGGSIASIWMLALGALLATIIKGAASDTTAATLTLGGVLKIPLMLIIVLGIVFVDALNAYGASLCLLTISEQRRARLGMGSRARAGVVVAVGVASILIDYFGSGNFLTEYSDFLFLLLYFLIPWSAINLVDFYVVRRGRYRTAAFFDPAGPYAGVKWTALACYAVGFLAEVPFMNSTLYEGPLARSLGGGDVSWLIGLLVAGGLYLALVTAGRRGAAAAGEAADALGETVEPG